METWRTSGECVFVCGSPYTEVSTVAWALAAHQSFWTSSESRFLYQLFGSRAGLERPYLYDVYTNCTQEGAWLRVNAVSYPEFVASLGYGIEALFKERARHKRWVDSSPENALMLDELMLMFPGAIVIGLLQPLRTALFLNNAQGVTLTGQLVQELDQLNTLYTDRLRMAASSLPDRVYLLEEADLFDEPDKTFADLLEFLGEDDNERVSAAFCGHLLRLGLPLAKARTELDGFAKTTNGRPADSLGRMQSASANRGRR
jgi:hypothetical protein